MVGLLGVVFNKCEEFRPDEKSRGTVKYYSIVDAAQSARDLSMMCNLGGAVGAVPKLKQQEEYSTVFAPRNGAFSSIPRSVLNEMWMPGNKLWSGIFWHHVTEGSYGPERLKDGQVLRQLDGGVVKISKKDGIFAVDGVPIRDVQIVGNGVIYRIDSLLLTKAAQTEIQHVQISRRNNATTR